MDVIKVDTKGLDCPIPLIELKKALKNAQDGQVIELEFTCPEAVTNLPNHCQENNHEVLSFHKLGSEGWKIVIKK